MLNLNLNFVQLGFHKENAKHFSSSEVTVMLTSVVESSRIVSLNLTLKAEAFLFLYFRIGNSTK